MPRKTRSQKIKTNEKLLSQKQPAASHNTASGLSYSYDHLQTVFSVSKSFGESGQFDSKKVTQYVISDLRRTFIVSLVAIIFELVIYWWLR